MRSLLLLALAAAGCATSGASSGGGSGATSPTSAVRPYPLDTCLVTGSRLGSMGDPYVRVYGDREIKFCCRPCVAAFEKDPERFLALLPK